jgi:hypothetical protein
MCELAHGEDVFPVVIIGIFPELFYPSSVFPFAKGIYPYRAPGYICTYHYSDSPFDNLFFFWRMGDIALFAPLVFTEERTLPSKRKRTECQGQNGERIQMKPDHLFVTAGFATLGLTTAVLLCRFRRLGRREGIACLLWLCFGTGLLLQGLAPHLRTERQRFLLPSHSDSKPLTDPIGLIERERRMQLLSALFTSGAAAGLMLHYRVLFSRQSRRQNGLRSARTG